MPPFARDPRTTPAMQIANLAPAACLKALRERKLPIAKARPAQGVALAVRLTGPIHGVSFHGPGTQSIHSIMDCRLVLALESFANVLAKHDVVRVFFGNTYRKGARLPGRRRVPSQHAYALAMDIVWFELENKTILRIDEDYHGQVGKPSCGPAAWMSNPSPKSIVLRNILCDVAREGVFHHMLTPNHDAAHASHLHVDIKRKDPWVTIR